MDHFGPAWPSFPATDRYDPARLWLACVSLALRHGAAPATNATPAVSGKGVPHSATAPIV